MLKKPINIILLLIALFLVVLIVKPDFSAIANKINSAITGNAKQITNDTSQNSDEIPEGESSIDEKHYQQSDPQEFTLIHRIIIKNYSDRKARKIAIKVPLLSKNNLPYSAYLGESLKPQPEKISFENNMRIGYYEIPIIEANNQIVLEQYYGLKTYAINYKIKSKDVGTDFSAVDKKYLRPEIDIESDDPKIKAYAERIAAGETNPYKVAGKLFANINLNMTYDEKSAGGGSIEALETRKGVCGDYTNLFIAAMRSLGFAARAQTGYLYVYGEDAQFEKGNKELDSNLMRHTWPEFYAPNFGWVPLDPTFTHIVIDGRSRKESKVADWQRFANINKQYKYLVFSENIANPQVVEDSSTSNKTDNKAENLNDKIPEIRNNFTVHYEYPAFSAEPDVEIKSSLLKGFAYNN